MLHELLHPWNLTWFTWKWLPGKDFLVPFGGAKFLVMSQCHIVGWNVYVYFCRYFSRKVTPLKLTHPLKNDGWKLKFPLEMVPFQGTHVNSRWEVISLTYFRVVSSQLQSIKYIMHEITVGDIRRDTQRAIPDDHRPWTPLIDICRWSQPFWRDEPVDIIMALEPQK